MPRSPASPHIASRSQRWRDRRTLFVPHNDLIIPSEYGVEIIDCQRQAAPFVRHHHYSGSIPVTRLSVGLFRKTGVAPAHLAGVAMFSVPMNGHAIPTHLGLAAHQGVELGRYVLLDEIPGNGESFFAKRAFSLLRRVKPSVIGVLAYSDPVERRAPDGAIIKPGHIGGIYRCLSANALGRSRPRTQRLTPDGQPFSERAASKIRNGETGHAYAIDELVRRGAPAPAGNPRDWYDDLVATGWLRAVRHPGNYVYGFPLTRRAKMAARQAPTYTGLQRAA